MPRMLCLGGLVVAGLVFLLFLVDLFMSLFGMGALFRYPSMLMDIVFLVCSGILGYLSWSSLKEIK
jgi:threonine/homoserine/homoserine lactone efflux protein